MIRGHWRDQLRAGDPPGGESAVQGRNAGYVIILPFHHRAPTSMSFIQANWMLIVVLLLSGGMLLWPLVQRRLSPMKDIGTLGATQLVNTSNAVLLDVREPAEFGAGRLPKAVTCAAVAARQPRAGARQARPAARSSCIASAADAAAMPAPPWRSSASTTSTISPGGFRAWKDAGLPVEK